MKMRPFINVMICLLLASAAVAQQQQQMGWFASFNTIKLNEHWGIHAELQLRSDDDVAHLQTILPRIGVNYTVHKNHVFTAGYGYILNRVSAYSVSVYLGEHRIWQQYLYKQKAGTIAIQHRLRLEERFVPQPVQDGTNVKGGDYLYSTRLRYFVRAIIPFKSQKEFNKGFFAALQDEVFANITDQQNVNGRFFDQNRGYAALGYRINKKLDVEAGYLNQYIQRRKGQESFMNHIVQLAVYTRL